MGIYRTAGSLLVIGALAASCRDPERTESDKALSSSAAALTGKELFGTYERKGEPYAGALASIALVPATCDPKQAAVDEKADGAVFATLYAECATPKCDQWKTTDFIGSYRIIPGEGNLPKVQIDLVSFAWGDSLPGFKGVVENLNVKYTLFMPDGTPCRATVNLKMKQANKLLNKKEAEEANKTAKGNEEEALAPSKKTQCASAACECAAQGACAGTWACVDHGCVCQAKPQ